MKISSIVPVSMFVIMSVGAISVVEYNKHIIHKQVHSMSTVKCNNGRLIGIDNSGKYHKIYDITKNQLHCQRVLYYVSN